MLIIGVMHRAGDPARMPVRPAQRAASSGPVRGRTRTISRSTGRRRSAVTWCSANDAIGSTNRCLSHAPHVHVLHRAVGARPDVPVDDLGDEPALRALGPLGLLHVVTSLAGASSV